MLVVGRIRSLEGGWIGSGGDAAGARLERRRRRLRAVVLKPLRWQIAWEERESKEEAGLFCWLVCVRVSERVCVEVAGEGEESPPPLVATGRRRTTLGEEQRGERDKKGKEKRERERGE